MTQQAEADRRCETAATGPVPQPGIMEIAPYVGGRSAIAGQTDVLKLSSNENPAGPSPAAVAAAQATLAGLHRYPGTDHGALRAAIGEVHGLDSARIVCGVGSDEVLSLLAYAYAGPGDEIVHTAHGFSLYKVMARAAGARPVAVPERDRTVDVDAILRAITPRTRIVYLTNPGNPTGTRLPDAELVRLADGLPGDCLLVIDGAYAEFAEGYDGGAGLAGSRANVVMTRTFSKLYGLGGLRVGWGYGPAAVIEALNRIRGPFNLSTTQLAAAEAAVRDRAFVAEMLAENAAGRARLVHGLRALGLGCDESHANFVLARFASPAEAQAADAHLQSRGIIVRQVAGYGLPEALRITVGRAAEVTRVLDALGAFREAAA